jgi:hypothetical protein
LKAANPQARILTGSLLLDCDPFHGPEGRDCSSAHFLEGILQAGGRAYFDGVAFQAADGFTIFDFPWGSAPSLVSITASQNPAPSTGTLTFTVTVSDPHSHSYTHPCHRPVELLSRPGRSL